MAKAVITLGGRDAGRPDEPMKQTQQLAVPLRGRRRFLLGLVAGAVLTAGAGLFASTMVKSPQQVAAEAGPPEPSVITAKVQRRVLEQTVVLRGTVQPQRSMDVTPVLGGGRSVITAAKVKKGDKVTSGSVVAEISGRPLIALKGRIPPYRDIRPGMKGPDVKELQAALRGLGYRVRDPAGTFGGSTRAAVRRLYDDRGYDAPTTQPDGSDQPAQPDQSAESNQPDESAQPDPPPAPRPQVYVPMSEIVFIPSVPALVTRVPAGLGALVDGPILTLSLGDLVVRGTLSSADRRLVDVGMPVEIYSEVDDEAAAGKVSAIGELRQGGAADAGGEGTQEQGGDAQAPGHPITVEGTKDLPQALAGRDVRLTIKTASTGHPVLAVPDSAIFSAADGSTQVRRVTEGGGQQPVVVRTGASAAGYVEVISTQLAEGDRVVVGESGADAAPREAADTGQ